MALSLVNVDAVRSAPLARTLRLFPRLRDPQGGGRPELKRDFPEIDKPGYLTVDEVQLEGRFKTLIDELESARVHRGDLGKSGTTSTPIRA